MLVCLSVLSGCSTKAIEQPIITTKTEYLSCPLMLECVKSSPVVKVNGDLLQAYILVKNERDLCAAQVDLTRDCQQRLIQYQQGVNVEN